MRILYFSRDYSSHDYRFLEALSKSGHTIAYLRLERRSHPQEFRPLPEGIDSISWRGGNKPARLKDGLSLLADLKRVINIVKPDLIQAGPIQRTAFLAALTGFKPLVSMSWGYDLLLDASRNYLWRWATRFTLKHSSALVVDCQTTRKLAIAHGMPAKKIVQFPWGIDLDHFSPNLSSRKAPDFPNSTITLLSTRSWEPIYGVDVLVKGFVKAAAEKSNLRLVMLNNGSQADLIQQILSPIRMYRTEPDPVEIPSKPIVYFPGQIGYSQLPQYYRSSDLYLSATHSDGTSISLLEAMACGIPALVSDIPGNKEWVQDGTNGWLFPDGDSDALAAGILHAVEMRARLSEMGASARQIAEKRANWEQNFPHLMRAYEIALHSSSGK